MGEGENKGRKWCAIKVDSDGIMSIWPATNWDFCGTDCDDITDSYPKITLGTKGMSTPNTCSVVLVAGSALHDLQSVKSRVNFLGHQMMRIPYIMVLLVDNPNVKLDTSSLPRDPAMVQVDIKKAGSLSFRGTDFEYFCQGESHSSKLILRQEKVNKQVGYVCSNPREVRMAYTQYESYRRQFELDTETNTMLEYPYSPWLHTPYHEMLSPFFSSHNLIPTWIDASGEGTDQSRRTKSWDDVWTGKIGLVSGIFFNIVQAHIDIYIYRVLWQHLMALSIGYR